MAQITEHPRYAVIQTRIDSFINTIHDAQALYFNEHGRYFQGITTPEEPQDGLTDANINWALKPHYQEESWKEFAPNVFRSNIKIPFQIRIDQYAAPNGFGWWLTIEVWIDGYGPDKFGEYGSHWYYQHHEGPQKPDPEYLDCWWLMPKE